MSFWRRLFGRDLEGKVSATGQAIALWTMGQPVYTPRNYEAFAKEAYERNPISHGCITKIADAASSIPWMVVDRSGNEIENHEALALLNRPNPMMPGQAMIGALAAYYTIAGNAYLEAVSPRGEGRPPLELWPLRPDRMRIVPGANAMPVRYEYEANGYTVRFDVDQVTGRSPIMHWRSFNPIDDFYGMSSVDPAARAIDRHTAAAAHNLAVLQNGASPSGALIFQPQTRDGYAISAPKELLDDAETYLASRHSGTGNAGRPMVLGGNVKWEQMGLDMERLQLNPSKLDAAQDICIAFGVPIALILPGQSTYNNMREAKLAFYEETVLPRAESLRDALNSWLMPRFGDGLRLEIDYDSIEALAPRREIRQEQTLKLYEGGVITLDEARASLQWQPADAAARLEIEAAKRATAALARAQAFQIDVNSGMFDEDALRTARAAQLAENGDYPDAGKLAVEPEPMDPILFAPPTDDDTADDAGEGDDEGAR